jgi:hypothetical protein
VKLIFGAGLEEKKGDLDQVDFLRWNLLNVIPPLMDFKV